LHVFLCLLIRLVLEGCSCLWVSSARMGRERGGFRWRFSYVLSTAVPSSFVYIGRCGPVVPGCHSFSLSTFVPNTQHYILSTPSTTKTQTNPYNAPPPPHPRLPPHPPPPHPRLSRRPLPNLLSHPPQTPVPHRHRHRPRDLPHQDNHQDHHSHSHNYSHRNRRLLSHRYRHGREQWHRRVLSDRGTAVCEAEEAEEGGIQVVLGGPEGGSGG